MLEPPRGRAFAEWLKSDEFLGDSPNVVGFDFSDLLAETDRRAPHLNMLREDHREGSDSRLNEQANQAIGPLFAGFIIEAVRACRGVTAEESGKS